MKSLYDTANLSVMNTTPHLDLNKKEKLKTSEPVVKLFTYSIKKRKDMVRLKRAANLL